MHVRCENSEEEAVKGSQEALHKESLLRRSWWVQGRQLLDKLGHYQKQKPYSTRHPQVENSPESSYLSMPSQCDSLGLVVQLPYIWPKARIY